MDIRPEEVRSTTKVGTLDGQNVYELVLKGGLHLLTVAKTTAKNGVEFLAAAPHRAFARFMARKKYPDLKITALAKSEHADPKAFEHLVPKYETITNRLNSL